MNRRDFIKKSTWAVVFGAMASNMLPLTSKASIPIKNPDTYPVKMSALDKIGKRRLIVCIKKDIELIGSYFIGELNDAHTRNHFNLTVQDTINKKYINNKLIREFTIVNDETTNLPEYIDKNMMCGKIYIQIDNTMEYVVIDFKIIPNTI